ncbi:hypothetical protein [Coleofasciculus sp. FACHB-1120]|uniref:hypothetical protein n=1 Tax=Coleofasciculus sp. FACHB-1120 TaxID=2692783 RepID=UPI001685B0BF|nr:hypothetical protein [Coleofasciculus sp. FACHB-1120]MBD2744125.1 hypothetical protein [Coleofasciculus sp. FACHB-1120]
MNPSIFSQACLLPSAIIDLSAKVAESRKITITDRCVLRTALLENSLSEDEQLLLNRMLYAIRRGRLALVNEF